MIGPHVLTPLARRCAACAGQIVQLADLCADAATAAALAIPLAAAVSGDPSTAIVGLGRLEETPRRRLALQATSQALFSREPELARTLAGAIAKASRQAPPAD